MPRYWQMPRSLSQLRREMEDLVTGLAGNLPNGGPWSPILRGQPAVNVWETPEAVHVELEVPGVKHDQLDLTVVGDQLTIRVERPESQEANQTWHRRERPVGAFTRVVKLPSEVDADEVEATLTNGVLTIHLPKAETARPRKINVNPGK